MLEHEPARGVVLAGFSGGASAAEIVAATLPGARAAILMNGANDPATLGIDRWPANVPAQVHYAVDDPWVDAGQVAAFERTVRKSGAPIDVYTYPGSGHLFADPDLSDYDPASAELMWRRVVELLERL